MIKLALAAGLTLTLLCGFMSLRGTFRGTLGGSNNKDPAAISFAIKNALGLNSGASSVPSSSSLITHSDSDSSSGGYLPPGTKGNELGGGGFGYGDENNSNNTSKYLPPSSSSDSNDDTQTFRIFVLSTSTTPSPTSKPSPSNATTSANPAETTPAPIESKHTDNDISGFDIDNSPNSNSPPVPISAFLGQGASLPIKPVTTLEPPTTAPASINRDDSKNEVVLNDDNKKNVSKPGNDLQPPNGLYLPPMH